MSKRDREILQAYAMGSMSAPQKHYHTENVTITEKRAPTDESIRLAKDYEERIWKDVTRATVEDIKGIDAQFVAAELLYHDMSKHIMFKINGRPCRVRYEPRFSGDSHSVMRDIAEKITAEILGQIGALDAKRLFATT